MAGRIIHTRNVTEVHSRRQICKLGNTGKVFEINDALDPDLNKSKIQLIILAYGQDNRGTDEARHWIDEMRAKALFALIVDRKLCDVAGVANEAIEPGKQVTLYSEMKGREQGAECQSRQMTLNYKPGNKSPYILGIKNGRGTAMRNGAVKPAGETDINLYVSLTEFDLYAVARETLRYIEKWESRHYDERQTARTVTFVPEGWAHDDERRRAV